MHTSLFTPDSLVEYSTKEAGPIILALAFIIGVGGVTAATIILCGWRGAKTVGFNTTRKVIEIVCR